MMDAMSMLFGAAPRDLCDVADDAQQIAAVLTAVGRHLVAGWDAEEDFAAVLRRAAPTLRLQADRLARLAAEAEAQP